MKTLRVKSKFPNLDFRKKHPHLYSIKRKKRKLNHFPLGTYLWCYYFNKEKMTKRYEEFISVSCTEDKRCIYELAYFIVKTSLPLVIPRNDYFVHFGEIDNNGLITQTYYDKFGEKTGTCKSSIELSVLDLSHKLEEDLLAA